MRKRIARADDVSRWRLCVGCGACVVSCEQKAITIADVLDQGLRPAIDDALCVRCGSCIGACPGLGMARKGSVRREATHGLEKAWGPVLEVWEGHAADSAIRFLGSSGGAATALSLYCLEQGLAGGVVHAGKNPNKPWRNETQTSRIRREVLANAGSRYSPASPCDGLGEAERSGFPSVFVGKPCDIHGLRKLQEKRPGLKDTVALAIGIFCAGTPATRGLIELLTRMGVSLEAIDDIRFRGKGWPGNFSVGLKGEGVGPPGISYAESWGFLNRYRPFRCYICPDGTSEFADVSCGDPWYREPSADDPGRSLVLVRTARGKEIVQQALKAGYLVLERAAPEIIGLSQSNLLNKRQAVWGRIAVLKAFGLPVPDFEGFSLFSSWLELPVGEKARSLLGTARRILARGYRQPISAGVRRKD